MGQNVEDRTGQVIGFLTVLGQSGPFHWLVRCDRVLENGTVCGTQRAVTEQSIRASLRRGKPPSCGCGMGNRKHGNAKVNQVSRTYRSWQSMVKRCENSNDPKYKRYGARGIRVCEGLRAFESFIEELGPRPDGKTIDRWPDTNSHYSCGHCSECVGNNWSKNVRWATDAEQQRNKTNNLILRRADGREMCAADWEKELGLTKGQISLRLYRGWSVEEALTPKQKR
jgi:hypothetical protein